jgi:hypothetical protein
VGKKLPPFADLAFFRLLADTFAMGKYWMIGFLLIASGAGAQIVTGGGVVDQDNGGGGISSRIQTKISNYVNFLRFRSLDCGLTLRVLDFDLVGMYHRLSETYSDSQLVCLCSKDGDRLFKIMVSDPAFIPELKRGHVISDEEIDEILRFYAGFGER